MIIPGNPMFTVDNECLAEERKFEELEMESMRLHIEAQKNEIKLQEQEIILREQQILLQQKQLEEYKRRENEHINSSPSFKL